MWTAERPPCQEAHQGAQACPGPRGQPHPSLHRQSPLRALSSTTQETPTASPSSSREAHPMALWHTSVRNNITHAVIRPCSAVVDAQICLPNTGNSAREAARNVTLSGAAQLLAACLEAPLGVTGTTKPDVPPYRSTWDKPSTTTCTTSRHISTDAHLLASHWMSHPKGARPPWCAPQGGGR